ncbi:endonuclease Q family protein [Rariglobus hedericola]|uniref:DNA helicase UvrD n=1 Tax=Rariglobus hedericola TaxID=2597822 RepID=A0A556QKD8_9BACT|nr:endonuclease Q family protein [Rariglobus hedericola]TSJ77072.1 DNA helicase UvrD [Rariglobus hedericola]
MHVFMTGPQENAFSCKFAAAGFCCGQGRRVISSQFIVMILAADLHIHSRYASAVSKDMTLENISLYARKKGVDLIGTGDCVQPDWLRELEAGLQPVKSQPGFFALRKELGEAASAQLSEKLRRPLRFLLSTEIHCSPAGTAELRGPHHLVYFPTFDVAWAFHRKLSPYGDLNEGRPRVRLSSRELLEMVLEHGEGSEFAPAHWLNPFFSICGSQGGGDGTLVEQFGSLAPHVTLVETGLTSTPPMCRRVSGLDGRRLYSNSDAHSLENIGREVTLIEGATDYEAVFAALRGIGSGRVVSTVKYAIERTRYFRNWCGICQESVDGMLCPTCGRKLAMGSRDRVEQIADRAEPVFPADAPPWMMILPLAEVLSDVLGVDDSAKAVQQQHARLLEELGNERYILTEATHDEIARVGTAQLARIIVGQRTQPPGRKPPKLKRAGGDDQFSLGIS